MKTTGASQTAMGTAALRAIESERPADQRICYDPLARKFIDPWFYLPVRIFSRISDLWTHGGSNFVVCRSRYIDDHLRESLASGTAQVVILGAGLDSRAYRTELTPGSVKVIEVDHPSTQARKIDLLKKVIGEIPVNVTHVPIDFNSETLDKLLTGGFERSLRTLFIWEGVILYLDEDAVGATLTWVAENAAPGSSIIFDYQDTSTLRRRNYGYAILNRLTGERRVFGIESIQLEAMLTRKGFTRVVNVNARGIKQLYCTGPNSRRTLPGYYFIVNAEVEGKPS